MSATLNPLIECSSHLQTTKNQRLAVMEVFFICKLLNGAGVVQDLSVSAVSIRFVKHETEVSDETDNQGWLLYFRQFKPVSCVIRRLPLSAHRPTMLYARGSQGYAPCPHFVIDHIQGAHHVDRLGLLVCVVK